MKDYITVSIDINGMRAKIRLHKEHLLLEFKEAKFFTSINNSDYFLTIRDFIRWQSVKTIYKDRFFKELNKLGR
jgi:hypothetical protein